VSSWIEPNGHYAFIEFRTPEEATNGFALKKLAIMGANIKVGRPKQFTQVMSLMDPQAPTLTDISGGMTLLGYLNPHYIKATEHDSGPARPLVLQLRRITPPTHVLVLRNMLDIEEL